MYLDTRYHLPYTWRDNAKVRERDRRAQSATSMRPLSNETINKTLTRLAQILEVAVEYGYIERNPAAGRRRKLKVAKPQRTYLDRSDQILALLDAAKELDAEARSDRDRAAAAPRNAGARRSADR